MSKFLRKTLLGLQSLFEPRFKILAYHGVPNDNPSPYEVSARQFREQMGIIRDEGYQVIDLHSAVQRMQKGYISKRMLVITFDDALESIHENAIPILKDVGFPATIFVPTGLVGMEDTFSKDSSSRKRIMSWTMLQNLASEGFALGSHSVNHGNLLEFDTDNLRNEFEGSYSSLVEHVGLHDYYFSYPFGLLNDKVRIVAKESSYVGALCFGSVLSNWKKTDLFLLKRERVLSVINPSKFRKIINVQYDLTRAIYAYFTGLY